MEQAALRIKLKTIPLFKNMSDEFYDRFIPFLKVEKFSQHSPIINEGDSGTDMYVLLKGTVRINKKTMSGDSYTAALLKDEYGIVFGELGLLAEDKRSATVLAESQCDIGLLKANDFNKFIEDYPHLGSKLLKELAVSICQKLKKSNHDMVVLYEALVGEIGQGLL